VIGANDVLEDLIDGLAVGGLEVLREDLRPELLIDKWGV